MKYELLEENADAIDKSILGSIESILFFSGEAIKIEQIRKALELNSEDFERYLEILLLRYSKEDSGITLIRMDDSVQLVTKSDYYPIVSKALSLEKKRSLSKAGAEVLAILAYKAPLTRIEIDQIRGVNSTGSLQRLLDQGLIEECGQKDVIGKPNLYRTTNQFLKLAGIQSLEELPSFEYFKEKVKNNEDSNEPG